MAALLDPVLVLDLSAAAHYPTAGACWRISAPTSMLVEPAGGSAARRAAAVS